MIKQKQGICQTKREMGQIFLRIGSIHCLAKTAIWAYNCMLYLLFWTHNKQQAESRPSDPDWVSRRGKIISFNWKTTRGWGGRELLFFFFCRWSGQLFLYAPPCWRRGWVTDPEPTGVCLSTRHPCLYPFQCTLYWINKQFAVSLYTPHKSHANNELIVRGVMECWFTGTFIWMLHKHYEWP